MEKRLMDLYEYGSKSYLSSDSHKTYDSKSFIFRNEIVRYYGHLFIPKYDEWMPEYDINDLDHNYDPTRRTEIYYTFESFFTKIKYYKGLVEAYIPIFYLLLEPTKYTGLNKLIILNNFVIKCESENYTKEKGSPDSFGNELIQNFINNFPSFNWRDTEENYNLFTNNVNEYTESDKYFNTGLDTGLDTGLNLVFNILSSINKKLIKCHEDFIEFFKTNNINNFGKENQINDLFQIEVYMSKSSFLILNKKIEEQTKQDRVLKYIKLISK